MNELKKEFIMIMVRFNRQDIIRQNRIDLSKSEIALLFSLHFANGDIYAKDLVKKLNFSKSMITTMLNNLECKEYIIRNFDKDDKRKNNIIITKKGNNFIKSEIKAIDLKIEELICKLGHDNMKILLKLMNEMMEVL